MIPGLLRVYKFHGIGKEIDVDSLVNYDIVMTTYATLTSGVTKGSSLLQQIMWFRIILDEGMDYSNEAPCVCTLKVGVCSPCSTPPGHTTISSSLLAPC